MSKQYKFYESLRRIPPIKLKESWMISRHEDVELCLNENKLFASQRTSLMFGGEAHFDNPKIKFVSRMVECWIRHRDDDVSEVKKELSRKLHKFTPEMIKEEVDDKFNRFSATLQQGGDYDLKFDLALPLMTDIAMRMLEVKPAADSATQRRKMYHHAEIVSVYLEELTLTPEKAEAFADGVLYLTKLGRGGYDGVNDDFDIAEYDATPYDFGDTQQSLVFATLIYNTTNMIANAMQVLLANRESIPADRLRDAILEALRLESPVQAVLRIATEDTVVNRAKIKKGEALTLLLASANRDDNVPEFKEPTLFKLDRNRGPLLAYGQGLHACIGPRITQEIAHALLQRIWNAGDLQFNVTETVWDDEVVGYRSLKSLRVVLEPEKVGAGV